MAGKRWQDASGLAADSAAGPADEARERWKVEYARARRRASRFVTTSGLDVPPLATPEDLPDSDYLRDLGYPGQYPFTRGIHPGGYRAKLWTMRMFAGFGSAEETNARFKYLLQQGQSGLSTAFDMPTLYGYDTDDPDALGEYGTCGVAISSLADMELLFADIPVDEVSVSMTITSPAAMIWAMYLVNAEKQGIPLEVLSGTIQNDILKEYAAQNEYIFPPEPSMRLVTDTVEFGVRSVPRWNTLSISGYHMREAGATAVQELAFTLADGFEYARWAVERGLRPDEFLPRFSFFFDVHNDFFEEICKLRAARRIWAREVRARFQPSNQRSLWMRFHSQTAGVSLTEQQAENNIIRTTIQALAAVLGGTQSLHTNALDEALSLPTDRAARIALRTQQIIAHESGVANTIDPLGGSYFVESLTNTIERQVYEYFERIQTYGGIIPALTVDFVQREIADSAYRYQAEIDRGERLIVGVNAFVSDDVPPPVHRIDPGSERRHLARLERIRRERDNARVDAALSALEQAARRPRENLMPFLMETARAYATLGEMTGVLRRAWGVYTELLAV